MHTPIERHVPALWTAMETSIQQRTKQTLTCHPHPASEPTASELEHCRPYIQHTEVSVVIPNACIDTSYNTHSPVSHNGECKHADRDPGPRGRGSGVMEEGAGKGEGG